ncbi:PAS domain S-box protein, partial [bacterium]
MRKSRVLPYLIAIAVTGLATLLRWALDPVLGDSAQYLYYYFSTMFAAIVLGFWPGLLAILLGAVGGTWFFFAAGHIGESTADETVRLLMFLLFGGITNLLAGRLHSARNQADSRAADLAESLARLRGAQESLRESEEKFRGLVDNMPTAVGIVQGKRFVYANRYMAGMLGHSVEEILSLDFPQLVHPAHREMMIERAQRRQLGEPVPDNYEFIALTKSGEERWIDFWPARITYRGKPALIGAGVDITERKRAQEILRESEQRLRATFENAASGIVQTDDQDRFVVVNDRICQMLGYAREELVGMSVHDLTCPEDRPRSDELNAQLHEGRLAMTRYEKRYLKRDGSPLWVEVAVSAVRDGAGHFLYAIGTILDISARKAAEAQVRLQAVALEGAPNAVSLSKTDRDGTIVWVNPAFTKLTGYSAEETIGQSHHMLSSGQQNGVFYRELWEKIQRGEVWRGELVNRRKDGKLYYEEMGITPLRDEDGKITHYMAIKQDITARKQAESALRESEGRFRGLADAVPLMIWQCGPDRRCDYFNQGWLEFTGRSIEQELGGGWAGGVHAEDIE